MARYEKGRKEETHLRVVKAAAERFRKDGIDGVGVATLMGDAGLTHGGFYSHFASKEALVKEAALYALGAWPDSVVKDDSQPFDLRAYINGYLSTAHRDKPAKGCPIAALGPDLARRPRDTRAAITKSASKLITRIASALTNLPISDEMRRTRAVSIFAQMSGSLQLSRVVAGKQESDLILAAGRDAALLLAGMEPGETAAPAKHRKTVSAPQDAIA